MRIQSEEGFGRWLREGKLSDGARRAWVERKVKVDSPASKLRVDYCEMSLMREFVAVKSISLRETVNTIHVLSVYENIGLNLFT